MSNGHISEADEHSDDPSALPLRSESELSDLNDIPPSRSELREHVHSDDDAIHDMATSEMDEDEDAPGEVDAEYESDSPLVAATNGMRHDRVPSEDSLRPGKRKPEVDDEEFMRQNPDLYGLRRSVRVASPAFPFTAADIAAYRAALDLHAEWYVH